MPRPTKAERATALKVVLHLYNEALSTYPRTIKGRIQKRRQVEGSETLISLLLPTSSTEVTPGTRETK